MGDSQKAVANGRGQSDNDHMIPRSELLKVLEGVAVATKLSGEAADVLTQFVSSYDGASLSNAEEDVVFDSSFASWLAGISSCLEDEVSRQVARLALAVAFLRKKGRQTNTGSTSSASPEDLAVIWDLIYGALISQLLEQPLGSASRSAQGFLAVPLCSLVKNGNIDELFRLHVWMPDGQRGNSDVGVHSHQPFVQSWILAGKGKDYSYDVELNVDRSIATHAEYALAWNDGKKLGKEYQAHQAYSVIANTGRLARAVSKRSEVHTRNTSYTIPAAKFHRTEVAPNRFHATLFFFDSDRGFVKDAGVLGPKDGESFTQLRDPAGITATTLATMVEAVRSWEILIEQGDLHAQRAEWEDALRAFNSALHLCESAEAFPDATYCRNMVLGRLGNTNRRFGRYAVARDLLERLLADLADFEVNAEHVEYSGELGVVYRHMNRLSDAKRTFETQYDMAKKLHLELPLCRAVGNLGVVNYQLSQQQKSPELLKLAIEQQLERVQRARQIQANADNEVANEGIAAHWKKIATTWEIIGLSRLSLCYAAHGDLHEAVKAASKGLEITKNSEDPTLLAMSRFFLGHALLAGGLHEEAMEQFNPPEECTPAIALCKEPSDEHRQYLQELVEAGVDMDVVDEHGYTALDYAVFNGDSATEAVVSEGLRRILRDDVEGQLQQRQTGARLRKAYRELFQEKLRPMLLGERGHESLRALRRVYANALDGDEEKRKRFDNLVLMRYSKFSRFGRLPRSSDNLVEELESGPDDRASDAFIIFISYRWINQFPSGKSPDDANHTQYHRMLDAVEEFLKIHRSVDREALYIWMDYACIDQGNPTAGVSALPMIIAQCDAVISLVDDLYYTRAWCAVEALLIQTLVNSYKMHLWYEQVLVPSGEGEDGGDRSSVWRLQAGPTNLPLVISEKHLSFEEEDRPKVLFLERQSKLFG